MTTFGINEFVRRQTADSEFSHYDGDLEKLLNIPPQPSPSHPRHTSITIFMHCNMPTVTMAADNFDKSKRAYRDGVINIPVPPDGFMSPVVKLTEGMRLTGEYKARREGETPRINIWADGEKTPAIAVELDFYHRDVLAENDEGTTDAEWELVNFRAMAFENEPIKPDVLMHNHFRSDGGTATNMTPEEFEAQLRKSFEFWKDNGLVG
jgi:hypothetical protein